MTSDTLSRLANAYSPAGKTEEARKLLAGLEHPPKDMHIPPNDIALVYAGLGDKEKAYFCWRAGYEKSPTACRPFAGTRVMCCCAGILVFRPFFVASASRRLRQNQNRKRKQHHEI